MSGPLGSSQWMYSSSTSFYSTTIDQSLRLNNSDNPYLKFDITSDGNRKTFTLSFWFKIGRFDGTNHRQIYTDGNSSNYSYISLSTADQLYFQLNDGAASRVIYTNRVLRDVSAWYHAVIAVDTTQVTDTDRVKIYINGEQETYASASYPTKDNDTTINKSGNDHYIGKYGGNNSRNFAGYLAEMHFVSGSQLAPTSFGETSNGIWIPKQYTGSHGTNGFHLDFSASSFTDNSSDPDVFADQAGSNNFNAYNFAATDIVSDSPTNSFCTLNPLTHGTWPTLKEGNLSIAGVYSADLCGVTSTWFPTTGKWYWEIHAEGSTLTYPYFGITDQRQVLTNSTKGSFYSVAWRRGGGSVAMTGTSTYMGTITKENATSWTNNDIIMFALDVDARKLWIGKNGTWNDSGDPAAGTGENASWTVDTGVSPSFMGYSSQGVNCVFNFGQDGTFNGNQTAQGNADENGVGDFYYSPPSGFLAMATSNIAEPTIGPGKNEQADDNFNTVLYTGDGSNGQAITGVGFQPDWLWVKARSGTAYHELHDSVRGAGTRLFPHETDDESTVGTVSSFDTDGFTVSRNSAYDGTNQNSVTFVGWSWKAGGAASSNGNGSITSSVSANTTAGFSIVGYTGTGSNATVGHGLSSAPEYVIIKNRDTAGYNFVVGSDILTSWAYILKLNLTDGESSTTGTQACFNSTAPTPTVFTVGTSVATNKSSADHIAYCFHSVEGFSKIGQFRGNSNSNGAFVNLGFRPAWVLIKSLSSGTSWCIFDNKREGYNVDNDLMRVAAATEQTDDDVDFLSNGLKFRRSSTNFNNSSHTYLYLAFADDPFKYANAR